MSNSSLFYVKALAIADHLRGIPDVLQAYQQECRGMKLGGDDGYTRLVLSAPNVASLVRETFKLRDFRVRFAFATKADDARAPQLEIYNVDGTPFCAPIPAHELPRELSLAVECELMVLLLRSKDIAINQY
jgi:hypothetical protein